MRIRQLLFSSVLLFVFIASYSISSVEAAPVWEKTYGGELFDGANSMGVTSDGGFVLAGDTFSYGSGENDAYLVRTDSSGNMLWNKTYGGADYDAFSSLIVTSDGGFALVGRTESYGSGGADFWLVRTDSSGNMLWNKTYGSDGEDAASSLVVTSDGGYTLAGSTTAFGGPQDSAFWLVRTDSSGNMLWNKTYGGTLGYYAMSLVVTSDGGYAIAGITGAFGTNDIDAYLVRTDSSGNMLWNKTYGGAFGDATSCLVATSDGGYALAGTTVLSNPLDGDFWLVRTDSSGNMLWNKTYGSDAYNEYAYDLVVTSDGGYAFAGDGSPLDFMEDDESYLIKTDSLGNMEGNQTYGGEADDRARCMVVTSDGGIAIAGAFQPSYAAALDMWLVKFEASVIPEFAGWLFLPFLMTATLIVFALRNRLKKHYQKP